MAEYFREFSLADHMSCPVHSSGSIKEWSGTPLEKSLQSHEGHEMPTDQPGLQQAKNLKLLANWSETPGKTPSAFGSELAIYEL